MSEREERGREREREKKEKATTAERRLIHLRDSRNKNLHKKYLRKSRKSEKVKCQECRKIFRENLVEDKNMKKVEQKKLGDCSKVSG